MRSIRLLTALPAAACLAFLLLTATASFAAELDDLFADTEATRVFGDGQFTEGPAAHPDGFLLFSDIPNERVIKVTWDGDISEWWTETKRANGLVCDQAGNIYACQGGAGQVARLTSPDDVQVLASQYDGKPFNAPNDVALDTEGGLYFTDPMYGQGEQSQPVQGVYYLSADGKLSLVVDNLPRPNGILVSPDGKNLVVANPNERQILKYSIVAPGKLSDGRVIFTGDEQKDGNGPDGMAFDESGNIYATYKTVVVLDSQGGLIGRVEIPEKPSNCTFAGPENKTLYVTARKSLYSLPMKVAGQALREQGPTQEQQARADNADSPKPKTAGKTKKVSLGEITLNVPVDWKQQQPSSQMRLGQFEIPAVEGDEEPAELAIFPPFGGSAQANVERWIGQFDSADRKVNVTQGKADGATYVVAQITGTYNKPVGPPILRKTEPAPDSQMLAVIYTPEGQGNYFFKLTGPRKTVDAAAAAFRASFGGDAENEGPFSDK